MSCQEKPLVEGGHQDDAVDSASNTDLGSPPAAQVDTVAPKKSLAFHFTFVAVLINLFVYALDATLLLVATPVSHPPPPHVLPFRVVQRNC